jgi:V/A-type H+-transporting ATPase subunit C
MRGRLLDARRFADLLACGDAPCVARLLQGMPYGAAIERAGGGDDAGAIEEGLRRELRANLAALRGACRGRWRELMDALLGRWEVENLKTLLRGRRTGSSVEEILAGLAPIGWSDEPALAELARRPSIQAMIETLILWRHPAARPLKAAVAGRLLMPFNGRLLVPFNAHGGAVDEDRLDLIAVESALDHWSHDAARAMLDPRDESDRSLLAYLGWVIDERNLLAAIRWRQEGRGGTAGDEAFVPGGAEVDRDLFRRLLRADDWERVADLVSHTRYGPVSIARGAPHPPLALLEPQIRRNVIHRVEASCRPDPLGFGLVIGYVERKVDEVRTLRMIAHGVAYGLDAAAIRPVLTLPATA